MVKGMLLIAPIGVLCLLLSTGSSQVATAQSTLASVSPSADASDKSTSFTKAVKPIVTTESRETEDLRNQIRNLQERLDRLEARQMEGKAAKLSVTAMASGPPSTTSLDPATQENPAKPTQTETANKDQDNGFLSFFRGVEFSGFIDGYFGYNFNKPFNRRNQLRNFDFKNNEFGLNLAELVVERKPSEDSRFGFRLDLDYGAATDWVHAAEPGGVETYKHVQQAYGSFLAPVGKGLQIDVGKFVTPHGAEVIETKDNWNYTRGLLFAWAIPYYHTGVRATYTVSDKVGVMVNLVNGWNNVEENNGGKTLGFQLVLKPTSKLSILQNYMIGPEESDAIPVPTSLANRHFIRQLYDGVLSYNFNSKVAAMVNYDYAIERQRATGNKVHWQGVAAYLRFSPNDKWAFSPRVEWFDDHDGFTTCSEDPFARCSQKKTFKEITLTGEYKFAKNVIGRLEFRNDWASTPFFRKRALLSDGSDPSILSKTQATITGGLIFTFSTREQ